jgi:O-antigen/teichoic acid export membrane protein
MLANKSVLTITSLVSAGLMNRALGPSDRGIYAEILTWIELFLILFGISMSSAIYHFANPSKYPISDGTKCKTILCLGIIYGIIGSLFLLLFSLIWPSQLSTQAKSFILAGDLLILCNMVSGNLLIFIQSLGRIKYSAMLGIIQGVMNMLLVLFAYANKDLTIPILLLITIAVQITIISLVLVHFTRLGYFREPLSFAMAKGIFFAGIKQHAATIATFAYMKINQLIVFKYSGAQQAGVFAVALNLAMAVTVIPMTLQIVLYPRIIHSNDDFEITTRTLKYCFYGSGAILISLFLLSKPLLLLYAGKDFLSAISSFRILLIAAWFLPLSSLIAPYCIKAGAFTACSLSAVFLGIISVILNYLFVPSFASKGAASATALTCFLGFGFALLLLWYISRRNPFVFLKFKV